MSTLYSILPHLSIGMRTTEIAVCYIMKVRKVTELRGKVMKIFHIVSAAIALGGPLFVILYDIIAREFGGPQATISFVVREWSHSFRELPYVTAGVMVWLWLHLFCEVLIKHIILDK